MSLEVGIVLMGLPLMLELQNPSFKKILAFTYRFQMKNKSHILPHPFRAIASDKLILARTRGRGCSIIYILNFFIFLYGWTKRWTYR